MNFDLTDEQRMLVESASRYIREACNLEQRRQTSATVDAISRQHWARFADMGWLALPQPERVDGLDGAMADLCLLYEELGRGLIIEPVIDSPILCASLLADARTASADALLSDLAGGGQLLALAHVEDDGRSEFETPITTTAIANSNGWQLRGEKHRVFYGHNADTLLVSAMLDGELALFAVPASSAGVNVRSYALIDGSRAADISLADVQVSDSALLLAGSKAANALLLALDKSILVGCAMALGSMETTMTMTADYLKTREQYGKPLAQFQALQHRMAEMLVETEQARSMLYRALSLFDEADQRRTAVSGAKVLISKAARWVTGQGIQLHGGIGTTEEYAVGHHYKAAMAFELRFGDSDWHLQQCDAMLGGM